MLDLDDVGHPRVAAAWASLEDQRWQLITTSYVVVEALTLTRSRLGAPAARRLVTELLPVVETHWVDADLHRRSVDAWLASGPSRVSLVDRVSFAFMRARSMSTAFAIDPDFLTEGSH